VGSVASSSAELEADREGGRRFHRSASGEIAIDGTLTRRADFEEFVHTHRAHGPLTADATEPA